MNLVVIVADTFRADYLGCYGNDWIRTPNLDRLGEEGVRFTSFYADGLPTIPERRVFFTGKSIIPMEKRGGWRPLKEGNTTLPERLQEKGFRTAFVTDTYHYFKPGMNFHKSFDSWHWIRGQETDQWKSGPKERFNPKNHMPDHLWNEEYDRNMSQYLMNTQDINYEQDYYCARTFRRAGKWLERNGDEAPFMLWVDTFDPHEPWDAPRRFKEIYYDDYPCDRFLFGYGVDREEVREEDLPALRGLYAAEVSFVDMWIGRLLDKLEELKLKEDTIVAFTSDHGTQLGEDGYVQKQPPPLKSRVVRLPLLIRPPGGDERLGGETVGQLVSSVDLMPTLLDLLDIEKGSEIEGRSAWPLAIGKTDSLRKRVFTEFKDFAAVRDSDWHYFQRTGGEVEPGETLGLYDLEEDPQEETNIAERHPDVIKEKRAVLEERLGMELPD